MYVTIWKTPCEINLPHCHIADWAEDYFIIAHNDYPWEKTPPLIIGRRGYDNYLVGFAGEQGVAVIGM